MKISIGADPEVFLKDKKGEFVSAHDLIPGSKRLPYKVKHGAVQVDGTAAEFNIDPCFTSADFVYKMDAVLKELRMMVPPKLAFAFEPTATYDKKYFKDLPDDCKILGCDPDYDLKGQVNKTPKPKDGIRYGGGHIHIGWCDGKKVDDPDHFWDCKNVSKVITDAFRPFIPLWDKDDQRSQVYTAGSFRPKSYGVEIRSFSNAWVKYPKLWPWMFETIQWTMNRMERGQHPYGIPSYVGLEQAQYYQRAYKMPIMPKDVLEVEGDKRWGWHSILSKTSE
jgi:hypothetical protein